MNISERRALYIHDNTGTAPICVNCKHFYQHYLKDGIPLWSGHCGYPRIKLRYTYDTCKEFERNDAK